MRSQLVRMPSMFLGTATRHTRHSSCRKHAGAAEWGFSRVDAAADSNADRAACSLGRLLKVLHQVRHVCTRNSTGIMAGHGRLSQAPCTALSPAQCTTPMHRAHAAHPRTALCTAPCSTPMRLPSLTARAAPPGPARDGCSRAGCMVRRAATALTLVVVIAAGGQPARHPAEATGTQLLHHLLEVDEAVRAHLVEDTRQQLLQLLGLAWPADHVRVGSN
mmetsp:Transcript_8420/g.25468  ORF Transcript_8420/g.25468 Transcript_8420/m.25468 type:complete len:219 (+) Transcript_8420:180-836(+)